MSYANGTQFYNLPQTVGTDKRDWFDTNSAFAAIDAALHSAVTGQASDAEAIATINGKLATDEADIAALQTKTTTHDSQIAALQTTVNSQTTQISDVRQDAEDMITANNEGAAATSTRAYAVGDYFIYNDVLYKATAAIAIGDTIVPNTNCEATNVDTELSQLNSDLFGEKFKVNGDGVKTISQILDSIYTHISSLPADKLMNMAIREYRSGHSNHIFRLVVIQSDGSLTFSQTVGSVGSLTLGVYAIGIKASGSTANEVFHTIDGGGTASSSTTAHSTDVVASGDYWALYY